MYGTIQQRISIEFCVRNEISAAETLKMLQTAFGEQVLSETRVYESYEMSSTRQQFCYSFIHEVAPKSLIEVWDLTDIAQPYRDGDHARYDRKWR